MGRKSMYTCMCNLVPMLYNGKKNYLGAKTEKKKPIKSKLGNVGFLHLFLGLLLSILAFFPPAHFIF